MACNFNCRQGRDCDCRQDAADVALDIGIIAVTVLLVVAVAVFVGVMWRLLWQWAAFD